MIFIDLS